MPVSNLEPSASEALEFYQILRQRIEHEDGLNCQRLSWLVASQSFLFTAYAVSLNAPGANAGGTFSMQRMLILHVIPLMAVGISGLIYCGIVAGILVMKKMRREFAVRFGKADSSFPDIQGTGTTLFLGHVAPLLLPLVFMGIWLFVWSRSNL